MFTLIDNTHIMQSIYSILLYLIYDLYVNMLYDLYVSMQTEEDPGEKDWNNKPAPWSGFDHFLGLIYFRVS